MANIGLNVSFFIENAPFYMKHYTTYLLFVSISIEPLKSLLRNKKALSEGTALFLYFKCLFGGECKDYAVCFRRDAKLRIYLLHNLTRNL